MRLIDITPCAKVYFAKIYGEYLVKFYTKAGEYLPKADYYTPDRDDATATAVMWKG